MNLETISTLTLRYKVENANSALQSVNDLTDAQNKLAVASDKTTRATESVQKAGDRLQSALDKEFKSAQALAQQTRLLDLMRNQGIITMDRHTQLIQMATEKHGKFSDSTKFAGMQMQNLGYQFNDIATMLASGQNPFVMMMQQGMQVGQIFTSMGLTLGKAGKAIGQGLMEFVTNPINIAVIAIAALAGVAGKLWSEWKASGPSIEEALTRQRDLIREMKDDLSSPAFNKFATRGTIAELNLASRSAMREFAPGMFDVMKAPRGDANYSRMVGPFAIPESKFLADLKAGHPDIEAFKRDIVAIANSKADAAIDKQAFSLLNFAKAALEADKALKELLWRQATTPPPPSVAEIERSSMQALWKYTTPRPTLTGQGWETQLGSETVASHRLDMAKPGAQEELAWAEAVRLRSQSLAAASATLGMTRVEAERYQRTLELTNAAVAAGIHLDPTHIQQIRDLADAYAQGVKAQEAFADKAKEIADLRSVSQGFATDLATGLRQGQSAAEALTNALNRLADKLLDMTLNTAFDMIFAGKPGQPEHASGLLATLFSGVFSPRTAAPNLAGVGISRNAYDLTPPSAAAAAVASSGSLRPDLANAIISRNPFDMLRSDPSLPSLSRDPFDLVGNVANIGASARTMAMGNGVQASSWNFWKDRGYSQSGIGAILGNQGGESGFNPFAHGDLDKATGQYTAFGSFQWRNSRLAELHSLYGMNPSALQQNQFAALELQRDMPGLNQRLMAGGDPAGLTKDFAQTFERPRADALVSSLPKRIDIATDSINKFGDHVTELTPKLFKGSEGMSALGSGVNDMFDKIGGAASKMGGAGGGSGGIFSALFGALASSWGGGFSPNGVGVFAGHAGGGNVGPGSPVWMGERGPELFIPDSYGKIIPNGAGGAANQNFTVNVINNHPGAQVQVQDQDDGHGGRRPAIVISEVVATGLKGSKSSNALRSDYGLSKQVLRG